MRNIIAAISIVIALVWFFTSDIYIGTVNNDITASVQPTKVKNRVVEKLDVDIKKLSLLLGVKHVEESDSSKKFVAQQLEVEIEIVVIYTSQDKHKLRISKLVDGEKIQIDMSVGDMLYNYNLIAIKPSSAILDNGEKKVTIKVFETATISVSDLPKEVLDQS